MLTGCYTDFEPTLESTPVVCMNSLITAGQEIQLELTRTWRWSEGNPVGQLDIYLRDAEVALYVNDRFQENLTLTTSFDDYRHEKAIYVASYIPQSGDRLRFHATDPTYGEADAEVTIPYPVAIDNVETRIKENVTQFHPDEQIFTSTFEMILSVTLTDPADASNYYTFDMPTYRAIRYESDDPYLYNPIAEVVHVTPDYSYEPIFSEHITPIETVISDAYGLYTMFSDRQFSGRPYTLEIPVHGSYYCDFANHPDLDDMLTLEVHLAHISTPYYQYLLSLWAETEGVAGALGGVGLADAVFEHSNVSTRAGIVATRALSTAPIPLKLTLHP